MIISVYGIPRSGKDTFIKKILANNAAAYHLQGSKTLNELAAEQFGCKFRQLSARQQNGIRILFTRRAKELNERYDLVIVDGHYAFPRDDGYQSVFTDADLNLYDVFFYLKRNGAEIARNFNSDDKRDYAEHLLSADKVEEWINFEIDNMQPTVEAQGKDFVVLDSDDAAVEFVCQFAKTSEQIAQEIADEISAMAKGKNIVLTDLDKTVSINDLTDDFMRCANIAPDFAKTVFKGDYYTRYQFQTFHEKLASAPNYDEAVRYALDKLALNENLVRDLTSMKANGCVVALTTGMKDAWTARNEDLQLFDAIFGYGRLERLVVTPLIKRLVAKYLAKNSKVVAVGDSVIDLGMLTEADKGYLIAMNKLDKRIIAQYGKGNISKTLLQPKYSTFKYDFTKEDDLAW